MTKKYEIDMCSGALLPKLFLFAVPLMLSSILQLLYNAADVIVVGRFAGSTALAAVSSTGSLTNLIVNLFIGLSVGANVAVAQYYGAKDNRGVYETVHTSMLVSVIGGVAVMLIGVSGAHLFLTWMGSPDDVLDQATLYMRIYFVGMPASMVYNFGSSILRAIGDTRRPLIYLTVSGAVNVVLNLVLVIAFGLGVAGVAVATIISQLLSAILVVLCLIRSKGSPYCFHPAEVRIYKKRLLLILRTGIPAGLQGSVFSISNVLIQSSINSFGSIAMAGNGAASNIEGFVYVAMNAFHHAALSFTAQNLGAGNWKRIRRVLEDCLLLVTLVGLGLGLLISLFGTEVLSIYDSDPEVIEYGLTRMAIILPTYFLCGMMDVLCGSMRGLGYSVAPMLVSLIGACGSRIVWIFTVFRAEHTLHCLYLSYPMSWALTASVHFLCFLIVARTVKRQIKRRKQISETSLL